MKEIKTSHGVFKFDEIKFENGIKRIDRVISGTNLLLLKECLDKKGLQFGLIYGTLLGAIRENNFIEHDEDTDVFILTENKQILLDTLFDLRAKGFKVGRYNEKLLSIVKDGEYIDIYFFKKKSKNVRESAGYIIKADYLENLEEYEFLGTQFNIPKNAENLLIDLYGSDWMTPKKDTPASNYSLYLTIRLFIKRHFKILFKVISWIKTKINV